MISSPAAIQNMPAWTRACRLKGGPRGGELTSDTGIAENRRSALMEPLQKRPTSVRHIVLGLTVAAYMITYMDRVVISTAVPTIRRSSDSHSPR